MRTADYFIHGRGRGHASRCPAVAAALMDAGYDIRLHTGGDALDLLTTTVVHSRPPLTRGLTSPLRLGVRAVKDAARFVSQRPDLVVSDGDHGAVLGGRAAGVNVMAIGHDLIFDPRVRLPDLPTAALRSQQINALPTRAAHRFVAVHFLPAQSDSAELLIARPESIDGAGASSDDTAPILCYFRDGNGGELARALARAGREVVFFGPGAISSGGIQAHAFSRDGFRQAMKQCSAVVGSAGSNMLAECVLLGKPVLAVYADGDAEQCLNAMLVERAGVGVGRSMSTASAAIDGFVRRVSNRDFASVDLEAALPPLSVAVRETLRRLE